MQESSTLILSILAVIAFVLAIYLGVLVNKLRHQKKEQQKLKALLEQKDRERLEHINESLRIIALAVTQDQCEVSEGCIRIKKLIDLIDTLKNHPELVYFHSAYIDFEQFPFLEERKKLSKQEKFKQDNLRFELEQKHNSQIKESCHSLLLLLKQ